MTKNRIFVKIILTAVFALLSALMLSTNKTEKRNLSADFRLKVVNKENSSYRIFDKDRQAKTEFINPELLYIYFKSTVLQQTFIEKTSQETDINKLDFIQINSETAEVGLQAIKYENSIELIFVSRNYVRKLMLFLQVINVFPEISVQENELIYFTYFDLNQLKYLVRKHYKIPADFNIDINENKVPEFKNKLFNKLSLNFYLTNLFGEKKEYKVNVMPVKDSQNIYKIDNYFIDFEHFKIALNGDLALNKLNFNFILDINNLPVNTKIINEQKLRVNLSKEVYFDLHNFDVSFLYIKINRHKELILVKEKENNANIETLLKHLKLNNFILNTEFKQEITLTNDLNSLTIRKTTFINQVSKDTTDYKDGLEKQITKLSETEFNSALTLDELKKSVLKLLANKTIEVKIISKNLKQGQFVCEFFDTKKPDVRVKKTLFFKDTQTNKGSAIDTEKQAQKNNKGIVNAFFKYKIPIITTLLASFTLILVSVISILIWRKRKNGKKN